MGHGIDPSRAQRRTEQKALQEVGMDCHRQDLELLERLDALDRLRAEGKISVGLVEGFNNTLKPITRKSLMAQRIRCSSITRTRPRRT